MVTSVPCSCPLAQEPLLPASSAASPSCRANLSDSYFTNRQDRYVFLQDCPEIADFFTELVDAVGDVSLQLQGDNTVQVVEGMVHPYKGRARGCAALLSVGVGFPCYQPGTLGWQSLILLLSLKPDGGDSLAISPAVPVREPVRRWELGFQGFGSVCLGASQEPVLRLQTAACSTAALLCHELAGGSVASCLQSEMRSYQLWSLETGKSWQLAFPGGISIPVIPVVVTF